MQIYKIKSLYDNKMCNLAVGIFSPFKHDLKEYLGYDITKFRDNIRFAEVLINRGGSPGGICPLYFDGAVNYFQELPLPNDNVGLNRVYQLLSNIRNKSNKVMIAFGYSKNNAKNLQTSNSLYKFATIFNKLKLKFKQWQIV